MQKFYFYIGCFKNFMKRKSSIICREAGREKRGEIDHKDRTATEFFSGIFLFFCVKDFFNAEIAKDAEVRRVFYSLICRNCNYSPDFNTILG